MPPSNFSYTCPCCHRNRGTHTPAETKKCSEWNKTNLASMRNQKKKTNRKIYAASGDNFSRWVNELDARGKRDDT